MSRSVDERVVEMQFQNQQFETGVAQSVQSIDKLKKSLDFSSAGKSLSGLEDAGKKFSFAGLTEGVDAIAGKFSALGVIGITALQNITNSALDAGKKIVSALTIDPIMQGFGEYELKMGSIQTIMAGTGASLDEVNIKLNELNTYADKTIYSFSDMTSSIGKFTNAGVSLNDAVAAIQGVANVAAISGANTNEASRAMYNFAQALSAGYVKLIDWKSIENANMATVEFKNQLLESAAAAGSLEKNLDGTYTTMKGTVISATKNFNDSLQDQWMTTEALVKTLNDYADATTDIGKRATAAATEVKTITQLFDTLKEAVGSGWAQTWELLIGDFGEAKALLTEINNVVGGFIDKTSDARNNVLSLWKTEGGRDDLIQGFKNAFESINSVLQPIKDAWNVIFGSKTPISDTAEKLLKLTTAFKNFAGSLKIGEETADKIKRTFAGLFAALDLVKDGFTFVLKIAGEVFSLFAGPTSNGILDVTAKIGDLIVKFHDMVEAGDFFNIAFDKIRHVITTVADKVSDGINRIKEAFGIFKKIDLTPVGEFGEKAKERLASLTKIGEIFSKAFETIIKVVEWAAPILTKVGSIIGEALGKIADKVGGAVKNLDFNSLLDMINSGLFAALLVGLKNFISSLSGMASEAGNFLSGITGILDGVRGSLEAYQSNLKAKTLVTIATAVGILAAALLVLSLIDSDKLSVALLAITTLFIELAATMTILSKAMSNIDVAKISAQMMAMSIAILILSAALKNLSSLSWGELAVGLTGITVLLAEVVAMTRFMGDGKRMISTGIGMIALGAAMVIFAEAIKRFGDMQWDEIARGLTAMAGALVEVTLAMNLLPKGMVSKATGLVIMGAALLIIASALKSFSGMQWDEMARGLTAMAGALAAIVIALNLLPKGMINKATALVVLGAALLIIGNALKNFGGMQWDEIARGLIAMSGALIAISVALNLMPKGMINKATALVVIGAALHVLIGPLKEMAAMQWDEIARGLTTLAGTMAILALGMNAMQKALPGAAAMLIVAPALLLMAHVLKTLGAMNLMDIGVGLLALAGIFTILGLAGLVLQPLIPTLLGLGVAVTLVGVGIAAFGAGLIAISVGLSALALGATAAAGAIVVIGSAVLSLIPLLFEKLGEGLVALAKMVILSAPLLGEALVAVVRAAMLSLREAVPDIAETIMILVVGILDALDKHLPDVVDKLFSVVTGFIAKIAENLPGLIKAGADLLGAFLKGIFDAMGGFNPENLFNLLSCITLLVAAFAILALSKKLAKDAIVAVGAMALVMGIITLLFVVISALDLDNILEISISLSAVLLAISASMLLLSALPIPAALSAVTSLGVFVAGLTVILAALGGLAQIPGLEWLLGEGVNMLNLLGGAIGSFVGNIVGGFLTGISGSFVQIGEDLSAFMVAITPFIEGARKIDASAMDGVKALAETVMILSAASIIEGLAAWLTGGSSMLKFGQEIAEFAPYFVTYYEAIKGVDGSVVEASANAALALAQFANNLPKEGGLAAYVSGENSITAFAEELVLFGPALMAYAKSVEGLDPSVVTNSANAAMTMAVFAKEIPNQGGALGLLAGDNTLSVFGEELAAFGPYFKAYSDSVKGVDKAVVEASAAAAESLLHFAQNVPNQGGITAWFTGDNAIGTFGQELYEFGWYFALYAQAIGNIDPAVVTSSANMAQALVALANDLPNTGGVVSWFVGDNNIADFGTNLALFGSKFAEYYGYVSGIDAGQMTGVLDSVTRLVELAKGMASLDTSGMTTFSSSLQTLADMGITAFIGAFTNSYTTVQTTVSDWVMQVNDQIVQKQPIVKTTMETFVTELVNTLKSKSQDMRLAGETLMIEVATGITNKKSTVNTAGEIVVTYLVTAMSDLAYKFVSTGEAFSAGLARGITNNRSLAINAAISLAQSSIDAANSVLKIASPSKLTTTMGMWFDKGFANGIIKYIGVAESASTKLATSVGGSLADTISALNSDPRYKPVIRPVVDMSEVEDAAKSTGGFFSNVKPQINMKAFASQNAAQLTAKAVAGTRTVQVAENAQSTAQQTTYEFNQYNTSPESLSQIDIYRNTQNQFSLFKASVVKPKT